MYKNVLQAIQGIEIYPVISMLIFILFFTAVVVWFFKADKAHLKRMADLPLDADNATTPATQNHQEE
ncbi:MAG TPA: CcoQ/FixQ family Cbb3-type cytochrome c oxidase assembly chaperone [Blastocatellia bacterium]|nr:CcoQ/FixQ family Cbb3-type cytochrome c oxidase assembly chaperone [Blastocatellia bacterium]